MTVLRYTGYQRAMVRVQVTTTALHNLPSSGDAIGTILEEKMEKIS
jgi:hypothetical protein